MTHRWRALVGLAVPLALCAACGGGGGGGDDPGPGGGVQSGVFTQQDADRVATIVSIQWDGAIPTFESPGWIYTDHVVSGFAQGQVTLNGTYEHWWNGLDKNYRYTQMTLAYSGYQEDSDMSSLTGQLQADGQIHWSNSGSSYSGRWLVGGTLQLTPPTSPTISGFQYACTVDVAFAFGTPYGDYVGKVIDQGTEWDVTNLD